MLSGRREDCHPEFLLCNTLNSVMFTTTVRDRRYVKGGGLWSGHGVRGIGVAGRAQERWRFWTLGATQAPHRYTFGSNSRNCIVRYGYRCCFLCQATVLARPSERLIRASKPSKRSFSVAGQRRIGLPGLRSDGWAVTRRSSALAIS